MRPNTFMEDLPVVLTEDEVHAKGVLVARKVAKLREHQEAMKLRAAEDKATEKAMTREVDKLSDEINARRETRPVECYEHANHARLRIETVRMDTMENVRFREMDAQEREKSRQGELFDYADRSFDRHTERREREKSEAAAKEWADRAAPANPVLSPEQREKIEAEARERAASAEPGAEEPPTH